MSQLDLFDLIEQVEWNDKQAGGDKPEPHELQVGDIIHVKRGNGHELEGRYVTCGFWDGRDQDDPEYFFVDAGGTFYHFSPYCNDWIRLGHDPSYQPPRKDNMTELLIERLKEVSIANHGKINVFREFEHQYPYLSYEYHPFVSKAWKKAIVATTTEEEVVANQAHWSCRSKLPKYVNDYIEKCIFPLAGEERLKAMWQMRWVNFRSVANFLDGRETYFLSCLPVQEYTYYGPLFRKLICETTSVSNLKLFCRLWGAQSAGHSQTPPGQFWIGARVIVSLNDVQLPDEAEEFEDIESLVVGEDEDSGGWCGEDDE